MENTNKLICVYFSYCWFFMKQKETSHKSEVTGIIELLTSQCRGCFMNIMYTFYN